MKSNAVLFSLFCFVLLFGTKTARNCHIRKVPYSRIFYADEDEDESASGGSADSSSTRRGQQVDGAHAIGAHGAHGAQLIPDDSPASRSPIFRMCGKVK